jgi:hypothetical protein
MKTTRYTIDLDRAFDDVLAGLAAQKGTTKAEIIRRALATYRVLSQHAPMDTDRKVSITDSTDTVLKDILIP